MLLNYVGTRRQALRTLQDAMKPSGLVELALGIIDFDDIDIYRPRPQLVQSSRLRCFYLRGFLLRPPTSTAAKHATKHVEHGIALPGYLDAEIHLSNLIQGLVPVQI